MDNIGTTLFDKGAKATPTLDDLIYVATNLAGIQPDGFMTLNQLKDLLGFPTAVIVRPDKLEIAEFLDAGVYSLPANMYLFEGQVDFVSDRIEFSTNNGFYVFASTNFSLVTYTGVVAFIQNALGITGNILDLRHFFVTTVNATAIKLSNGNSFISDLPIFLSCERPLDLDNYGFCTLSAIPFVACADGALLNNVKTISGRLVQSNSGPNTGGVAYTISGADSERCFMSMIDSRMEATEFFIDIQSSYGGIVNLVGGVHDLTTGTINNFFKTGGGSRDHTDVDVISRDISGAPATIYLGSYVVDSNTTTTTITDTQTWTDLNLNSLAIIGSNSNRFTLTNSTTGELTYIGNEPLSATVSYTLSAVSSGGSQEFWFRAVKNGVELDDVFTSRVELGADLLVAVVSSPITLVKNNTIRPQVWNEDGTSNVVISTISTEVM